MKIKSTFTILLIAILLSACGAAPTQTGPTPDVAAVRTSAASTVISQFTLTAAAFTPTLPPPPSETATQALTATATTPPVAQVTNAQGTPIALCDSLTFDLDTVDVTIPDGTIMTPGQDFTKTWKVKNNGSCPWGDGYKFVYAGYSDDMSGQWQTFTTVIQPGQEVEISVQFKAPDKAGTYVSAWQMQNPKGVTFPEAVFVKITVQ